VPVLYQQGKNCIPSVRKKAKTNALNWRGQIREVVMDQRDTCGSGIKEEDPEGTSTLIVQSTVMIAHLEDGRAIPIISGGMVDIAIHELGARLVEIEELDSSEESITQLSATLTHTNER
jgi:hypothetical protein